MTSLTHIRTSPDFIYESKSTLISDASKQVLESYEVALQGWSQMQPNSGFASALLHSLSHMQNIDKVSHYLTISKMRNVNNRLNKLCRSQRQNV
jgi:hypothetical protein